MRYAAGLEYDGTEFLGWQRLGHGRTLQAAVEAALGFVADSGVEVVCSGRTDAGVHARMQVFHFDAEAERSARSWLLGANSRLPPAIALLWVQAVDAAFHARFAARSRRYRYRVLNRPVRPGLQARYLAWERLPLDAEAMHAAAQALCGEHDFSAFRTSQCQARHPQRTVLAAEVRRTGQEVVIDVEANAFLHHMVRNIVGSLLPIGRGDRPVEWLAELLAGGDRRLAGPTADARGLCFLGPRYPADWGLPDAVTVGGGSP